MLSLGRMERWIEREGQVVRFRDIAWAFVGTTYHYRCATPALATDFASYLAQRDPDNPAMMTAVGDDVRLRYRAERIADDPSR